MESRKSDGRPCRLAVSKRIRWACMISAGTFGDGVPTLTKVAAQELGATGACCAAAPGQRRTAWKCNRLIATWEIAMSAMLSTGFVACSRRTRTKTDRSFCCHDVAETVEKWNLSRIDFAARDFVGKKFCAVDLRKFFRPAGSRRPFDFKSVAFQFEVVRQIAFKRPGVNRLAGFLFDGTQRNPICRRFDSELFFKFTPRAGQQILSWRCFAFGNRPRAVIFVSPKRATRMNQEKFEGIVLSPEHE